VQGVAQPDSRATQISATKSPHYQIFHFSFLIYHFVIVRIHHLQNHCRLSGSFAVLNEK
jgi:hypothetical protein